MCLDDDDDEDSPSCDAKKYCANASLKARWLLVMLAIFDIKTNNENSNGNNTCNSPLYSNSARNPLCKNHTNAEKSRAMKLTVCIENIPAAAEAAVEGLGVCELGAQVVWHLF